jgi:hypothetical protein
MSQDSVTFVVCSYNQERYIREAVESAFAQTFHPMEILLSDDCSTDRTFEIMEQMAAAYRGPNKVVLNRNATNLGVGSHVNRVMDLATGDIIIGAAGDDISLPERTGVAVDKFRQAQGRLVSLSTATIVIDDQSREVGRFFAPHRPRNKTELLYRVANAAVGILGCSHTWTRQTFDAFGPLRSDVIAEDRAIAFRAYELGDVELLDLPLVKYRTHSNNIWSSEYGEYDQEAHRRRCIGRAKLVAGIQRQFLDDMRHPLFRDKYPTDLLAQACRITENKLRLCELEAQFVGATRMGRFGVVAQAAAAGVPARKTMKWLARCVLPERTYYNYGARRNRAFFDNNVRLGD